MHLVGSSLYNLIFNFIELKTEVILLLTAKISVRRVVEVILT